MTFKVRVGSSVGPTLSIPDYPNLAEFTVQQQALQTQLEDCQSRRSKLEQEGRRIDQANPSGLAATTKASQRRAAIVSELAKLDREMVGLEYELTATQTRQRDLLELIASTIYDISELRKKLGAATLPEDRAEIREELLLKTKRLAVVTGDPKLQLEAQALEKEIEESRDYIVLRECWYLDPTRTKAIPESEVVSGSTTLFGRGYWLPKDEAKKWSISQ